MIEEHAKAGMKVKFFCPLCKVRVYSMRRDKDKASRVNCAEHGTMKLYLDGSYVLVKPVPSRAIRKEYALPKSTQVRGKTLLEMAEEIHNRLESVPLVVWLNDGSLSVTRSNSASTLERIPEGDVIGRYDSGVSWDDLLSDLGHFHDRLATDVLKSPHQGNVGNQGSQNDRDGSESRTGMCSGANGTRAEIYDWTEVVKAA